MQDSDRRVVVTGIGTISALGNSRRAFWDALRHGRGGILPCRFPWPEPLNVKTGAFVENFNAGEFADEKELQKLAPFAVFARAAAQEAVLDSGIVFAEGLSARTAIVIGTATGGIPDLDESYRRLFQQGKPTISPLTIVRTMTNAPVAAVSIAFGITGPAMCISTACASGTHSIGIAFQLIRSGVVDAAVAGGTEGVKSFGYLKAWEALRVLSPELCRPFGAKRAGLVLGEGAAMVVLESLAHARERGADVYAEIVGFGMTADAEDFTFPSVRGCANAMKLALTDAGITPDSVDYINAHGTGTVANDVTETRAIHDAFGPAARKLSVSSTKSMHGHALGAAGALEFAATCLAVRDGTVPPTINIGEADPECDLDYTPDVARERPIRYALSNSFAFGGLNATLIVGRA